MFLLYCQKERRLIIPTAKVNMQLIDGAKIKHEKDKCVVLSFDEMKIRGRLSECLTNTLARCLVLLIT